MSASQSRSVQGEDASFPHVHYRSLTRVNTDQLLARNAHQAEQRNLGKADEKGKKKRKVAKKRVPDMIRVHGVTNFFLLQRVCVKQAG